MNDWTTVTLAEVGNIVTGSTPSTAEDVYWGNDIPFITPADISNLPYVCTAERKLNLKGLAYARLIPPQSVLVTCIGSIGKIAYAISDCTTNQQINSVIPFDNINARFLYYGLANLANHIKQLAGTTAVPIINKTTFSKVKINLPPIPQQKKIARILTTVDNLIEKTEALIEKYKAIKQGMMHDLFTRGVDQNGKLRPPYEQAPHLYKESPLGWIPKEWEAPAISSVLERRPKNGYSPKESNEWTGVLMLGLGCLTPSGFEPIQLKNAPKNDPNVASALLRDGDLLISRSNTRELVALVGRYRGLGYPCIYSDLMMRLVPIDAILPDYMEAILRHAPVRRQLTNASCGTSGSMMKINSQMVLNTVIPLPHKSEQQELLNRVASVSGLVRESRKELEKHKKAKSGLMQDLLTGKVRVKVDEVEEELTNV